MTRSYYPSINILRGIAALLACVYHFTNHTDHHGDFFASGGWTQRMGEWGTMGVFVFFIITGFVIPLSMMKYDFRLRQLPRFLAKRWLRIEIPYIASIALFLVVDGIFHMKNGTTWDFDVFQLLHHLVYTVALCEHEWYNPIYWTLAIEMQFYLLIAFLFPLFTTSKQWLNGLIPMAFAASSLLLPDHRLVFHYAPIFSQGIYLLLIMQKRLPIHWGIAGILMSAGISSYVNGADIAATGLVTIAIIAFTNIDWKPFNRLGTISYSLYLTHGLIGGNVIYLLGRYAESFGSKMLVFVVALFGSIAFARVYWWLIERPSQGWSKGVRLGSGK